VESLGGGRIEFLGYIDPTVGQDEELFPYTQDRDGLIHKITKVIKQAGPQIVITHGINGEYGHPGHILTHLAVRSAIESFQEMSPILYSFCADFPGHPRPRHANPDNPAHIILDVSTVMEQKINAAYCHRSQIPLFLRRRSKRAGYMLTVPEILLPIESLHRVLPSSTDLPSDDLIETLLPWQIFSIRSSGAVL
jgi:LmbE family N-acetylglucosaminyl deacetylase